VQTYSTSKSVAWFPPRRRPGKTWSLNISLNEKRKMGKYTHNNMQHVSWPSVHAALTPPSSVYLAYFVFPLVWVVHGTTKAKWWWSALSSRNGFCSSAYSSSPPTFFPQYISFSPHTEMRNYTYLPPSLLGTPTSSLALHVHSLNDRGIILFLLCEPIYHGISVSTH